MRLDLDLGSLSFLRQAPQDYAALERRYCLFIAGKIIIRAEQDDGMLAWISEQELQQNFVVQSSLNMGKTERYALFAIKVADNTELSASYVKTSLLNFMLSEPEESAQLVGRAAQLLHWQETNQFCGKCGEPLHDTLTEYSRVCKPCNSSIYPRISPCIITLVTHEKRLLLATNSQVHGKWYSTLAGFVEPGESLEEALAREVLEEVGVSVKNITYFSSQPWPFPAQLMMGFFAEYAGGEIIPDGVEIEHADWFEATDLPKIPGKFSIAGKLIHHFIENS